MRRTEVIVTNTYISILDVIQSCCHVILKLKLSSLTIMLCFWIHVIFSFFIITLLNIYIYIYTHTTVKSINFIAAQIKYWRR